MVLQAVGAAALAGLAVVGSGPGRLLALLGAVGLAALTAGDIALSPFLTADVSGLTVVAGFRRRHHRWGEVTDVRVVRETRRFVRTVTLEIDLDDELVLVPVRRLGTDVDGVAARLGQLRSR